jgi:DNA damage-binding protein 2
VRILDLRKLSNFLGGGSSTSSGGGGGGEDGGGADLDGTGSGGGAAKDGAAGGRGRGRGKGAAGGRGARGGAAAAHPCQLALLQHKSVINSAWYSPVTGRKIMTTCQVGAPGCGG